VSPLEHSDDPFSDAAVVARYEDWYTTSYGRVVDGIERALLVELVQPLQPPAGLLEIGCGTAHFGAALREAGFRVTGVDPSAVMLRAAGTRVQRVRGAGEQLPFVARAFDGAFLVSVLEFANDPVALLREARRVTRSRVVLLAIRTPSYLAARRRLAGHLGNPIFANARFRTRRQLVELAHEAGFDVEEERSALFLPPLLAGRLPRLEQRLSRGCMMFGGLIALALRPRG
jgi:ubiquinone/menaquinone biosynthesis C-methylase UbiE